MGLKERRKREKSERRGQIMAAARSLLFDKGLAATSINQIAKRAELGVGTIYFYFQSKEELFAVLQVEGLQLLLERIASACEKHADPAARLKAAAMVYLEFSNDQLRYFDVINYFLSAPEVLLSAELKRRVDQKSADILAAIADIVTAGVNDGMFRPMDADETAILFWGSIHGLVQFRKLESTALNGRSHTSIFSRAVDHLLSGLKSPAAAGTAGT
ncbi:MAG: TetR/AcrR family transcriptional regulator [Pseudomonadota bacterium]